MFLSQRIAFRRRIHARATLALMGCMLAALPLRAALPVGRPSDQQRATVEVRNVLLITIDTLRADHLGSYGHDVDTPHLDRLAREGVRFDQVATTSPLTLPAHASILTGRYPFRHGVRDNLNFRLRDDASTLAEVLGAAGYAAGAFVGASVLDVRTGIGQGFTRYGDPSRPLVPSRLHTPLQVERRADDVITEALSWIAEREERFFAWIHLFDPHAPYTPPAPFRDRYAERAYDGEIAYVDHTIGGLLAKLAGLGHEHDTLVVVTADHGEGLGEHGEQLHSLLVYDSTMRVPLILWAPGLVPAGTMVTGQASVADIMPTVLALLGIPDPDHRTRDGTDLRPLIAAPGAPGRPVYLETMVPFLQFGWSELRALRGNGFKYIHAPRPELYDMQRDGGETENLVARRPEVTAAMRADLAEMADLDDIEEWGQSRFVDPQLEARLRNLRALGYVGATASPGRGPRPNPKDDVETLEAFQNTSIGVERALANQRWREADVYIETLASLLPDHPMVSFYRGRSLLGQGQEPEAIGELETAVSLAPANTLAWMDLAQAHWVAGNQARAHEVLESAIETFPTLAALPLRQGHYLQQQGRYDEAERAYMVASELAPMHPTVLRRLADLYLVQRDLDRAERALTELVAVEPDAADAWSALADVRCALDRPASCEAARRNAIVSAPERADLYVKLGELLLQRGNRAEAIEAFRAALRIEPDQQEALEALRRLGIRDARPPIGRP